MQEILKVVGSLQENVRSGLVDVIHCDVLKTDEDCRDSSSGKRFIVEVRIGVDSRTTVQQ